MGRGKNTQRHHQQQPASGPMAGAEAAAADAPGPSEHWRYERHLASLAVAPAGSAEAEAEVVAEVLRDPDPVMAESAVVTHLNRRAARLPAGQEFAAWAQAMTAVLAGRAFPERRLREWSLLKAVTRGASWSAADLTAASDWCQRTAAHSLDSAEALTLLAAEGRTRRVRNAAAERLRRRAADGGRAQRRPPGHHQ